jgi:hypothetical protein
LAKSFKGQLVTFSTSSYGLVGIGDFLRDFLFVGKEAGYKFKKKTLNPLVINFIVIT